MKHVILGAGGSIGKPLAGELLKTGEEVFEVSRSGSRTGLATPVKADLTHYDEINRCVRGTDVVYLVAGLFDTTVSELYEMLYQSQFDYYFDSTKFNSRYSYQPVSYEEGIYQTIRFLKNKLELHGHPGNPDRQTDQARRQDGDDRPPAP